MKFGFDVALPGPRRQRRYGKRKFLPGTFFLAPFSLFIYAVELAPKVRKVVRSVLRAEGFFNKI
jgi:hypothetical protein